MGTELQFAKRKSSGDDFGDGYITMWMPLMPSNWTFKNDKFYNIIELYTWNIQYYKPILPQ